MKCPSLITSVLAESAEKEKINVELERLKVINTQFQQEKELLEVQLKEVRKQNRNVAMMHIKKLGNIVS